MILCTAQISPCWQNPDATLNKIRTRVAEAVEYDASCIAFPEQAATGWDPEDATSYVQDDNGSIISTFREYARDFSIGILGSFREIHEDRPRNTTVAIDAKGTILAKYSKIHLFTPAKEDLYYSSGDTLGTFMMDGCFCGLAICYDLRFSDLFRAYRQQGVDLMLVPSAWPSSRMRFFEVFTTSRAAEYQMYVACINTTGVTPVDQYSGGSLVAGPDGAIITRGSQGEELLFTDIDPDRVAGIRTEFPVFHDRKEGLYQRLGT
jgi:predicted amidohydrolase